MSNNITIVGFPSSLRRPQFAGETKYLVGGSAQGSLPLRLLLVGLAGSGGSITTNSDAVQVNSVADADVLTQPGSELNRMAQAAFNLRLNVPIYIAAPAAADTPAAATATITVDGTWTVAGSFAFRVSGETYQGTIAKNATVANVATAIVNAFKANPRSPVTAASTTGSGTTYVVTLTVKCAGARGNNYFLFEDATLYPSGFTSAIAGGTAVTGAGVPFTGGSGVETLTTLLGVLLPNWFERFGIAQVDSTSLAAWKTQLNTLAAPTEERMGHLIAAFNGLYATAASLASSTCNDPRMQICWQLYNETHPSEIAAIVATIRTANEAVNANAGFDGMVLPGVAPQRYHSDWVTNSGIESAIASGVTPLETRRDGSVAIVLSVSTKCLIGSNPVRTLETNEAYVPDFVRSGAKVIWDGEYKPANPNVAPDPAPEEPPAAAGLATPTGWNNRLKQYLLSLQTVTPPILIETIGHPPTTVYDHVGKRLMSIIPVVVAPLNHQAGASAQQVSNF